MQGEARSGLPVRGVTKAPGAFRTIAEVATDLDVPQHVLRFWETKFPQIKPLKRRGGRRYYRPEDVALLRHIRSRLYVDGYTIRGVQKLLKETGGKFVLQPEESPAGMTTAAASVPGPPAVQRPAMDRVDELRHVIADLERVRDLLERGFG